LIEGPLSGVAYPVMQTSANRSGEPAVAGFGELDPRIVAGADLAIDGGALGGSPSTVVDLTEIDAGGGWAILREGALSPQEVGRLLEPDRGW
jgi:tRNA A37 threonylcarbamoyladenosine synthetase subunit TsaC/SUA5/YrdC